MYKIEHTVNPRTVVEPFVQTFDRCANNSQSHPVDGAVRYRQSTEKEQADAKVLSV